MSSGACQYRPTTHGWAKGRLFRLALEEWGHVERECNSGLAEIATRLGTWPEMIKRYPDADLGDLVKAGALGSFRHTDVRIPILYGLLGAGETQAEAHRLVEQWVDGRGLLENVPLAYGIVMAALTGGADDPPGKSSGEGKRAGRSSSPTGGSAGRKSTASARPAAGRRAKSTA